MNEVNTAVSNEEVKSSYSLEEIPVQNKEMTAGDIYKSVLKDYPDVLDVNQVSTILGVSSKTVYRLLNEGSLASLKIGRSFKIPKLYVMQYIKVLDPKLREQPAI